MKLEACVICSELAEAGQELHRAKFARGLWDFAQAQALSTHFDPEVHTSGMQGRDFATDIRAKHRTNRASRGAHIRHARP